MRREETDDCDLPRRKREGRLDQGASSPVDSSSLERERLIHELQVHQVELELQNEELRKTQARLEESHANFAHLYDFAPVGYLTFDNAGRILEANLTAASQLKVERSRLLNSLFPLYLLMDDRDSFRLHLNQVFRSQDRQRCEVRLASKKGVDFHALLESIFVRDADGNGLCRTSVMDITDLRRAEEALLVQAQIKESHKRLLTVLESLNSIVYAADIRNHEVLYANRHAREIFGDVEGKLCWRVIQAEQTGPCSFCCNDRLLTPEGEPAGVYSWEFQNTVNGRWYLIYDQAIRWTDGRLARLEIATDMTEQKQIEEQLRQQAKILDEIHDAVIMTNANSHVTGWNAGSERLFGYSSAEALGRHLSFLCLPDQRESLVPRMIGTLLHEGKHDLEVEVLKKSGQTSYVHLSLSLLHDNAGLITGMVGYAIDISRRKNYERQILELQDFYQGVLENIVDGVCVTDPDDKIRYVNSGFADILGINTLEILGRKLFEQVLNGRLHSSLLPHSLEAKQSGKPVAYDSILLPVAGDRLACISGWLVPRMINGGYQGMIMTALDVTWKKQAEDALKQSEEKFRSVFHLSPLGNELYDANGHLIDLNQAALDLLGLSDPQRVMGQNLFRDRGLPDKVKTKLLNGEVVHYERELDFDSMRSEGLYPTSRTDTLIFDVTLSALSQGGSTAHGFLAQIRDITARRRTEEDLLKTKKLEATGVLAAGIAHDFNNLLSIILGNLNIARMDLPAEHPLATILEDAREAATRAKDLTGKFITFATGGAPLKRAMDIRTLLEDSVMVALSGSNVRWTSSLSADLSPVVIDEGQIRQAVTNVIVNAREALPHGGQIHLHAHNTEITVKDEELFPVLGEGRYVMISVEDQGMGIPENHLERIFDPYFSTKDRGSEKGMGFGLAITHSVIKRHGGHIDVSSVRGTGTRVNLYLPVSLLNPDASTRKTIPAISGARRILVMDDEKKMLDYIKIMFLRMGHEAEGAENGEEAMQMYLEAYEQSRPFDLVILDLTVKGGMGGEETVALLRKIDPGIKAVVSSGYSEHPVMKDFRAFGFDDALPKPYTVDQLEDILRRAVGSGTGGDLRRSSK